LLNLEQLRFTDDWYHRQCRARRDRVRIKLPKLTRNRGRSLRSLRERFRQGCQQGLLALRRVAGFERIKKL
jgi:hypothetical protein